MSINGHAKRTIEVLEGLGFEFEGYHEGKRTYRHPIAPDKPIRVHGGISEVAARKLRNAATEIAGYGIAGERIPASIKDNARVKRQDAKAKDRARVEREARDREPFERAATERKARIEDSQRLAAADRRRREIEALMRPGRIA